MVPRRDDVMGEIGVAVVVADDGRRSAPSLDALRASGEARLARHKLPEHLVALDALPLTPMEKLDRRSLRARRAGDLLGTGQVGARPMEPRRPYS